MEYVITQWVKDAMTSQLSWLAGSEMLVEASVPFLIGRWMGVSSCAEAAPLPAVSLQTASRRQQARSGTPGDRSPKTACNLDKWWRLGVLQVRSALPRRALFPVLARNRASDCDEQGLRGQTRSLRFGNISLEKLIEGVCGCLPDAIT